MIDEVHKIVTDDLYYSATGIKKQVFNTIYQLYADKKSGKLNNAASFLMVTDYLHFLLTGVKTNEYTNASTTGLLNSKLRDWDRDLIKKLGLPDGLFKKLSEPGTVIGGFSEAVKNKVGFDSLVVIPATHDTASAVMAVPIEDEHSVYISSGTWSLIGIETDNPNTDKAAMDAGYTNEGGYKNTIRFLKNILGLWMIQCIKKEYNDKYSFTDFVKEANGARGFSSIVDVNDLSFFAPMPLLLLSLSHIDSTESQNLAQACLPLPL